MLSSNPSKLYLQSGRTTGCLMCKADIYCITKIALKTVWLSHCMNTELYSASALSAQETHWSRATWGGLEGTLSELCKTTALFQRRGHFQLLCSQKTLSSDEANLYFWCFCLPGYALREFRMIPILVWGKQSFRTQFSFDCREWWIEYNCKIWDQVTGLWAIHMP